ncbi:MAG: hypothetical protein FJW30_22265 [Acidobacteria bacterium]|nr:hypothetical protein [Acidobacteriota bacterium]
MLLPLLLAAALPGSAELTRSGDLAERMVNGIDTFLARRLQTATGAFGTRDRFRHIIGLRDQRVKATAPEHRGGLAVRWPVLDGVDAEGLMLEPTGEITTNVVLLPDASETPEQAARRAPAGARVLIPVLIDRADTWSGNPAIRMTNQSHREYLYRMSFQSGRHIIGYEVQKVLAAVDWYRSAFPNLPVEVSGTGEGGLIALYAAAADERIAKTTVAGYFRDRHSVPEEPIYRNVWGLLPGFGDAELARLIHPRQLIVGAHSYPSVDGPPPERAGRAGAAPGRLSAPSIAEVRAELERAGAVNATLVESPPPPAGPALNASPDAEARQYRQFRQLVDFSQRAVRDADKARKQFWRNADLTSPARWAQTRAYYDEQFQEQILGRLGEIGRGSPAVETRKLYDNHLFEGFEAYIPVIDEVFAYGILLIPKGLKPGERRPLVIAQHGLEGRPQEIVAPTIPGEMRTYQRFAARLAERGFVVFAPQNPYIFGNKFRQLTRKGDPLAINLFAFVQAQYTRSIDWLETLPFVDKERIGFYGLSYGGYTALRIPPLEPRIKAVVCSGNFNEWSWKVTTDDQPFTYLFTREYEIHEFNQTNTFGHAEMATLIAPRPFMVERGHSDGVGIDEWVAYEFAKVRRLYAQWQKSDLAVLEFFNGVHQIWGDESFRFLHRHLNWP